MFDYVINLCGTQQVGISITREQLIERCTLDIVKQMETISIVDGGCCYKEFAIDYIED